MSRRTRPPALTAGRRYPQRARRATRRADEPQSFAVEQQSRDIDEVEMVNSDSSDEPPHSTTTNTLGLSRDSSVELLDSRPVQANVNLSQDNFDTTVHITPVSEASARIESGSDNEEDDDAARSLEVFRAERQFMSTLNGRKQDIVSFSIVSDNSIEPTLTLAQRIEMLVAEVQRLESVYADRVPSMLSAALGVAPEAPPAPAEALTPQELPTTQNTMSAHEDIRLQALYLVGLHAPHGRRSFVEVLAADPPDPTLIRRLQNGMLGRMLQDLRRQMGDYYIATSRAAVSVDTPGDDYMRWDHGFEELGSWAAVEDAANSAVWDRVLPIESSPERTRLLTHRRMAAESPVYVLYIYHGEAQGMWSDTISTHLVPMAPPAMAPTVPAGAITGSDPVQAYLQQRFGPKLGQIAHVQTMRCGTAYRHCTEEKHFVAILTELGVRLHLREFPRIEVPGGISVGYDDVVQVAKLNKSTLAGIRTAVTKAREARRQLDRHIRSRAQSNWVAVNSHQQEAHDERSLMRDTFDALLGERDIDDSFLDDVTADSPKAAALRMSYQNFKDVTEEIQSGSWLAYMDVASWQRGMRINLFTVKSTYQFFRKYVLANTRLMYTNPPRTLHQSLFASSDQVSTVPRHISFSTGCIAMIVRPISCVVCGIFNCEERCGGKEDVGVALTSMDLKTAVLKSSRVIDRRCSGREKSGAKKEDAANSDADLTPAVPRDPRWKTPPRLRYLSRFGIESELNIGASVILSSSLSDTPASASLKPVDSEHKTASATTNAEDPDSAAQRPAQADPQVAGATVNTVNAHSEGPRQHFQYSLVQVNIRANVGGTRSANPDMAYFGGAHVDSADNASRFFVNHSLRLNPSFWLFNEYLWYQNCDVKTETMLARLQVSFEGPEVVQHHQQPFVQRQRVDLGVTRTAPPNDKLGPGGNDGCKMQAGPQRRENGSAERQIEPRGPQRRENGGAKRQIEPRGADLYGARTAAPLVELSPGGSEGPYLHAGHALVWSRPRENGGAVRQIEYREQQTALFSCWECILTARERRRRSSNGAPGAAEGLIVMLGMRLDRARTAAPNGRSSGRTLTSRVGGGNDWIIEDFGF
ncbi:hypothetical protein R3P38DRAFT_3520413 [Favolaschia claudopus]|uniref:Uncharacterized protein n=1 Tax=Favolaschia claudopus TaxID=2862362 RepID=A0AAW0BM68_9AGAR